MIKYYKLFFTFDKLATYQRDVISKLIDDFGASFGETSLCVYNIRGKKAANILKAEIEDYFDYCHIMHYSNIE